MVANISQHDDGKVKVVSVTLNSGPHNERDSFVPTIAGSLVITRLSVSISQIQPSIAQSLPSVYTTLMDTAKR